MTFEQIDFQASADRNTVRVVSKIVLSVLSLAFLLYLVTLLPGVDRLIPRTPITFAAVIAAIVAAAVVALLVYVAPRLAALIRDTFQGPQAVVENIGGAVHWLVLLAAVLVAHRGFTGAITPFLDGFVWVYDMVFLIIALVPMVFLSVRLYAALDPGAEFLADRFGEEQVQS